MKEAISGAWLFQIVIVMVLLFSGFLAIALNYSKAFQVKNGVVNIIQRQNGVYGPEISATRPDLNNEGSRREIQEYLGLVGYRNSGECRRTPTEVEWAGLIVDGRDGNGRWTTGSGERSNQRFHLCIYRTVAQRDAIGEGLPDTDLYRVEAFFRLDLPLINQLFNLSISGTTTPIFVPGWDIR